MSSESSGADPSTPPSASLGASPPPAPAEGRPSAVQSGAKLERRLPLPYALVFYGFLFAVAWIWTPFTGARTAELWTPKNPPAEVALGVGAGLLLASASPSLVRVVRPLRELEREFGWILGEQRAWECVVLAALSGVSEEFFFRGAMQSAIGPWLSVFVFAALHWPINAQFKAWPIAALAAGAVLAAERVLTGTLLAPVLTHTIVNAVNMLRITSRYRVWKE